MLWAFTIYSLKTGACLAGFYLFFKLLLSRETFHRLNRMLILGATAASFALPLCVITRYRALPAEELPAAHFAEALAEAPAEAAAAGGAWPWQTLAGIVLLAGALATLALTLRSLLAVGRILRRGRRERLDDGSWLVVSEQEIAPFSWGRHVVVSRRDLEENGRAILTHERAHVRLHHSRDLLLTDLAGCLQWFNPAMWLLRRELRALHEYEADALVLDSGVDARTYQLLLIKKAAGGRWYSVANSFNHSKLKNRITMMLQKRSSRWAVAKALLVLPLAGVALGAFAETAYVVPDDKDNKKGARHQEQTTIVVTPADASDADTAKKRISITGSYSPADSADGPLYIVDGKQLDDLQSIAPSRIKEISVLKDAAAVEQYGEKAKNGVILVTLRPEGDTDHELTVTTTSDGSDRSEVERTLTGKMERITVSTSPDGSDDNASTSISISASGTDDKVFFIDKSPASDGTTTTTTTTTTVVGDGKVDSSQTIHITGNVSIRNAGKFGDQLILIDGKEASVKQLEKLDSEQIDRITMLKGAAATDVYGEKAAIGAIVVTTKKHKK